MAEYNGDPLIQAETSSKSTSFPGPFPHPQAREKALGTRLRQNLGISDYFSTIKPPLHVETFS